MQHQAHVDALLGQLGHHGVEQERHVAIDHLDDRDGADALRAHRAGPRLETDLWRAGLALLEELPGGLGKFGNLARLVARQVLARHAREHQRQEAIRHVAAGTLDDDLRLLDQPADSAILIADELPLDVHGVSPADAPKRLSPNRTAASREKGSLHHARVISCRVQKLYDGGPGPLPRERIRWQEKRINPMW